MGDDIALISACLLGIPCRHNGRPARIQLTDKDLQHISWHLVPVCPEQLGGLPTPRVPVEIQGGDGYDVLEHGARVIGLDGADFTAEIIRGAQVTVRIAKLTGASRMITQSRSPSCSSTGVYDGSFGHKLRQGYGVCAALLCRNGLLLVDVGQLKTGD